MKVVDLESLLDAELFEDVSEECSFLIEGACGSYGSTRGSLDGVGAPPVSWMLNY